MRDTTSQREDAEGRLATLAKDFSNAVSQTRQQGTEIERLRGLYEAQTRNYIEENNRRAEAEAKVAEMKRLIRMALKWHIFSFAVPDEDGNIERAHAVEEILRRGLDV